jgi:pSer/pThr/pTyr-binding forkhead associated (FHA) protein
MASLVITTSPVDQQGKLYRLGRRTLAAGRDPSREIQITDPKVSRKHFLVRAEGEGHMIVETKAKNGIFVNGNPVEQHLLVDGDEIKVGETVLTYYAEDREDQTNALDQYRAARREYREDRTIGG